MASGIHCVSRAIRPTTILGCPQWILACLLACLLGCHAARGTRGRVPSFETLEVCLDPSAESLDTGPRQHCARLLEGFLAANPGHPEADRVSFRLGRLYLRAGQYRAAYHLFHGFEDAYPKSRFRARARLNLGTSLYFLDNPEDSLDVLQGLAQEADAAPFKRDVYRYIAEDYVKLGRLSSALTWFSRCYALTPGGPDRETLEDRILGIMRLGWDPDALHEAAKLFQEGFFAEAIRLGVAAACIRQGQPRLAEDYLLQMSAEHPDDVFSPHIRSLLQRLGQEGIPQICTIGCLLPLTGRYERFGRGVLNALLLGARAFEGPGEEGASIRLLVRDTEGDPAVAVQRLRELAADSRVVGLVGPLRASVAFACGREAERLKIPMITLCQREEVARAGEYVFQNGLTLRQQVDTVVEYVMEEMGLSSFAVLYPDDAYGRLGRSLFEQKVSEMGGDLVAAVPYEEDETDFQDEIRELVGEEFLREVERRERQREQEERPEEGGEAGGGEWRGGQIPGEQEGPLGHEEEAVEHEPVSPPFQALFIPDHYRKVALIAPHLALYDVNEITLLGTNAWDSPQLIEMAGEYVRDAIFADGFFAESEMPYVREFVEQYGRAFQAQPQVLEAQGYDSLIMLEDAFRESKTKTREAIRAWLAQMDGYPGLSGYTRFNEDGSADKRLYILSVIGNHIQQIY